MVFAAIYTLRVSNLCLLNKTSYYQKFFFYFASMKVTKWYLIAFIIFFKGES